MTVALSPVLLPLCELFPGCRLIKIADDAEAWRGLSPGDWLILDRNDRMVGVLHPLPGNP